MKQLARIFHTPIETPPACSRRRNRLCENSEMAFWKNEKRVLGPLAAKENAPYRNCGGRFFRVAGWRGVFAQSGQSAVIWPQCIIAPTHAGGCLNSYNPSIHLSITRHAIIPIEKNPAIAVCNSSFELIRNRWDPLNCFRLPVKACRPQPQLSPSTFLTTVQGHSFLSRA